MIEGRIAPASAVRATQVLDPEMLFGVAVSEEVAYVGGGASKRATDAGAVGGEEGGRRLALDKRICAPRGGPRQGEVWDLVFAITLIAGAVFLVAYEDGAAGDGGGGVAPGANACVVAAVVVT